MNMLPIFICNNHANSAYGDVKPSSKHLLSALSGSVSFFDMHDLFLRKLVGAYRLSINIASILIIPIFYVICVCTKPKMSWVNAISNVAPMQNVKTVRNWAIMNFPGLPMRPGLSPINHCADPIPLFIFRASPKPAGVGFVHLFPKFFHGVSYSTESL